MAFYVIFWPNAFISHYESHKQCILRYVRKYKQRHCIFSQKPIYMDSTAWRFEPGSSFLQPDAMSTCWRLSYIKNIVVIQFLHKLEAF
jgi:hypothetical protein